MDFMDFFFSSFRKVMLETGLLLQSFWTYLLGCHTERLSHSPIFLTLMSAFVYVDSDLPNTMNGSLNCSNAPIKAAKRPLLHCCYLRASYEYYFFPLDFEGKIHWCECTYPLFQWEKLPATGNLTFVFKGYKVFPHRFSGQV